MSQQYFQVKFLRLESSFARAHSHQLHSERRIGVHKQLLEVGLQSISNGIIIMITKIQTGRYSLGTMCRLQEQAAEHHCIRSVHRIVVTWYSRYRRIRHQA